MFATFAPTLAAVRNANRSSTLHLPTMSATTPSPNTDNVHTESSGPTTATEQAISLSNYWLVQVDRDWRTSHYGRDIRLYHKLDNNHHSYVSVSSQTINADGSVTVNASNGKSYILVNEPNIKSWVQSEYAAWKSWDSKNGAAMDDDRSDYEPWAFKTRAGFADGDYADIGAFYRET